MGGTVLGSGSGRATGGNGGRGGSGGGGQQGAEGEKTVQGGPNFAKVD